MLTVLEAANRAGCDPETVRRWIRSGKLPSKKVGGTYLIDEDDLEALLDEDDALFDEDDEMLPLPDEWKVTFDGQPQPNWVRIIRRSRESH